MDFDHPKYGEVYTTIYLYIYIILNQQGVQPSPTTNFRQGARSYPPPAPGHGHAAHRGALPPARPSGLAPLAPWADADLLPGDSWPRRASGVVSMDWFEGKAMKNVILL